MNWTNLKLIFFFTQLNSCEYYHKRSIRKKRTKIETQTKFIELWNISRLHKREECTCYCLAHIFFIHFNESVIHSAIAVCVVSSRLKRQKRFNFKQKKKFNFFHLKWYQGENCINSTDNNRIWYLFDCIVWES